MGSPIRLIGEENSDTTLAYDEFGVPLVGAGTNINQPFGFTGYQTDDMSGLYYAQARYYAPELGRFGAEDCIFGAAFICPNSQIIEYTYSLNQYNYCYNCPLVFVDSNGYWPEWLQVVGGVAMIAGAVVLTTVTFGAAAPLTVVVTGAIVGTVIGAGIDVAQQYYENDRSFENYDLTQTVISGVQGGLSGVLAATPILRAGQVAGNTIIAGVGSTLKGNGPARIASDAIFGALGGYVGDDGIGRGSRIFFQTPVRELLKSIFQATTASNGLSLIMDKFVEMLENAMGNIPCFGADSSCGND